MIQIIEKTTQKGLVVLYLIFGVYFLFDLLVNYVEPCSELICTVVSSPQIMYHFLIEFLELVVSCLGLGEGGCDCTALAMH